MLGDNPRARIEAERLRAVDVRRQRQRDIEAHVQAIRAARADLEARLLDLQGHCDRLQRASRLMTADDGETARYRLYHTAQTRMIGALSHALKRARGMDRLLELGREERQERERRDREETVKTETRAAVREVLNLQLPREDDFEQLFGEVM